MKRMFKRWVSVTDRVIGFRNNHSLSSQHSSITWLALVWLIFFFKLILVSAIKIYIGGGGNIHRYVNLIHVQEQQIMMKKYFVCNYCRYVDDLRIICSVSYQNQYIMIDVWSRLLAIFMEFLNFSSMFQVCSMWFLREFPFSSLSLFLEC